MVFTDLPLSQEFKTLGMNDYLWVQALFNHEELVSQIQFLTSKISHICQEICDIKSKKKPQSHLMDSNYVNACRDRERTGQNYTREPDSNNSAKEGSGDEGGWDETCSSHSKLCHHEPNNLDNSSHHVPSLPSPSPTLSGNTPLPPAILSPSPTSKIGTSTPSSPS